MKDYVDSLPSVNPGMENMSSILNRGDASRRGKIIDLNSLESLDFAFAPEPVTEDLKPTYGKLKPFGMSHGYHYYEGTENAAFSFDLMWNRLLISALTRQNSELVQEQLDSARRFLESICYAPELRPGEMGGSPSPVLLLLPNLLVLRCRLMSLKIVFTQQDGKGYPMGFTASTTWEEAPTERITSHVQRAQGMFRGNTVMKPRTPTQKVPVQEEGRTVFPFETM
jgi:hypothetical protein